MVGRFGWFSEPGAHAAGQCTGVLDLGASAIRLALIDDEGTALTAQEVPSSGVAEDGAIMDLDRLGETVLSLKASAEAIAGHRLDRIVVTVPNSRLFSFTGEGFSAVSGGEVALEHLARTAENAVLSEQMAVGQRLIHALPTRFTLDDQDEVEDPIGLTGYRLGARFFWVFCEAKHAETLARLCQRIELPEPQLIAAPLAAAMGGLTRDEAELGGVVIDIGHIGSSITAWSDGLPVWMGEVPAGGRHLNSDLRQVFNLSAEQAHRLIAAGLPAIGEMVPESEMSNLGRRAVDRHRAARVLQARFEDLFQRSRSLLTTRAWWRAAENGVVLTGGGSRVPGVERLAETVLECPVRVASMETIERDWTWPPVNAEVVSFRNQPAMMTLAGGLEFVRMNALRHRKMASQRPWPAPDLRDLRGALMANP